MKKYKVTDECIACHACVEVAGNNFAMGKEYAFVKKQPENKEEEQQCEEALEACPVNAIIKTKVDNTNPEAHPILAKDKVYDTLEKYPHLKDILINFSSKFKRLLNPIMYNTLAKFATFADASRVSGVSLCEILHLLNKANGTEKYLEKMAPECIKEEISIDILQYNKEITWTESEERYIATENNITEIITRISNLKPQESIVIYSTKEPIELVKVSIGLEYKINVEKAKNDYRISIFNPQNKKEKIDNWHEHKNYFDELDVRDVPYDPFEIIMGKAQNTDEGEGFVLIQRFEPVPMINMLTELGFEYETEHVAPGEVKVYFYKTPVKKETKQNNKKVEIVLQSATPVAYPIIARLLESKKIRQHFNIKELKVWEETEKHLAWVTNGKADITFSSLITTLKLQKIDIKVPAILVWDNFVILTRYQAKDFGDLKGKEIYTPLFAEAPPAKITKYLIKASGYDIEDFKFVYGNPFGRPEQIYKDFVEGKADTVILREPEASYALKIMQDRGEQVSVLSYNEIWNKIDSNFGSFPNACLVLKGEFVKKHPEESKIFLEELQKAIEWINNNRLEASKISSTIMKQPIDRVELFLQRVNFNYVSGEPMLNKVKNFFGVLIKENIVEDKIDDNFLNMFNL